MSSFVYVFMANALFSGPSLLLIIATSHLGDYEASAVLGLALSVCAPVQLFLSMQHNVSILSGRVRVADALRTRFMLIPVFLSIGALVSICLSSQTIAWFFLYRSAEYLYEPVLVEGFRAGRYKKVLFETMSRFLLFSILVLLLFAFGKSLNLILLLVGSIFFVYTLKYLPGSLGGYSKVSVSLALGSAAFVSSIIVNIPRYFVPSAEPAFAAFYSSVLTLALGGGVIYGAINSYLFPKYSLSGDVGVWRFLTVSSIIAIVGLFLSILLFSNTFLAEIFVNVFVGNKYLGYAELVAGFACFYFVLYFHSALNLVFVYLRLGQIYVWSLVFYGFCLVSGIALFLERTSWEQSLIWFVLAFGMCYGVVCYLCFKRKLTKGAGNG